MLLVNGNPGGTPHDVENSPEIAIVVEVVEIVVEVVDIVVAVQLSNVALLFTAATAFIITIHQQATIVDVW